MTRQTIIYGLAKLYAPELVQIDEEAIAALGADFSSFSLVEPGLPIAVDNPRDAIPFLLAQTALQYRFWDGSGDNYRRYELGGQVGSRGMVLGFERAWGPEPEPGLGILECASYTPAIADYFDDIPDPHSRSIVLCDVLMTGALGQVVDQLDAAFRAGRAGVEEAQLISSAMPAAYEDPFIKKSQLAVGLMVAQYRKAGIQVSENLFAYADYQIPAVLRHLGVLRYAPKLAAKIDARELLSRDSIEETSIRFASVLACELIAKRYGVTAAEVDWFCWLRRKEPTQPFHLALTTCY